MNIQTLLILLFAAIVVVAVLLVILLRRQGLHGETPELVSLREERDRLAAELRAEREAMRGQATEDGRVRGRLEALETARVQLQEALDAEIGRAAGRGRGEGSVVGESS